VDRSSSDVLLVSADRALVAGVLEDFTRDHFSVRVVADGAHAVVAIRETRFDLVILSTELPDGPGVRVCRELRHLSSVPVILVSAGRWDDVVVRGFEAGADAFALDPSRRELLARCRAVLRRCPPSARPPEEAQLSAGDVVLDLDRHEVFVGGTEVALTLKEFQLLTMLLANAGRVVSRESLITRVWGPDYFGDTKTLDVHIRRIRGKIERPGSPLRSITTVRGVGYRYEKEQPALAHAS